MHQHSDIKQESGGLSGLHQWLLGELQRTPRVSLAELAWRLDTDQATCATLAEELVCMGYLQEPLAGRGRGHERRLLTGEGRALLTSPKSQALAGRY